ncbi:MAG: Gfo/Idh/MocA family oxidoreductase [Chthoniobacterales bacterium]
MPSIRFGFIGTGQVAFYAATGINKHADARVVAAQDVNATNLKDFCKLFSIEHSYSKVEDLFANPDIDAIYIAVPNKFHVPLAIQALEAGKHVILEKPFAMSLAEAQEAAEVSRRTGKVLTLGMNLRFEEPAQRIKTLVDEGALGEIYRLKAHWLRRAGIPKLGTWFGNKALAGGGCLYDLGVHLLDLSFYLVNDFEPVSVYGATFTKFGHLGQGGGDWGKSESISAKFDVEDQAAAMIRFANGSILSLDIAWAGHAEEKNHSDIHLYGTKGGALVMGDKLFKADPVTGDYLVIQEPKAALKYPHADRFHNFVNHLLGKEALCVTLEQALGVQRVLDAIAESSATGREVRLDKVAKSKQLEPVAA